MNVAIYPGSFDPITNGHIDIIKRAADIFDSVIVLISCNPSKSPTFPIGREALVKEALRDLKNVSVDLWDGLLVDYVRKVEACVIIKGLRAVTDFEYEFQMALTNKALYNGAETVFLTASTENMYLSSSMVKQIARFGGDVSKFVPKCVEAELKEMYALCH